MAEIKRWVMGDGSRGQGFGIGMGDWDGMG